MKNRLGCALMAALVVASCGRTATAGPPPPAPEPSNGRTPAAGVAGAPADTTSAAAAPGVSPAAPTSAPTSTPTAAEFEALYRARADSARLRYTAADVRFITGMIHHHAQAIVMSRLAPDNGASASVRTLAARIINAQQDEIRTMQQWLRDRSQPVPEVDAKGAVAMAHDTAGHMQHDMGGMAGPAGGQAQQMMPGMLTAAQLDQLSRARGRQFDRLFLTDMIQHHRGAITMVNDLFGTAGAGQEQTVFKLASDVQVDQTTEVARMERMLAQLELSGQGL